MKSRYSVFRWLVGLPVLALSAFADEPTAFQLVKQGNDYVGKESRDQVVQIRSDKSINSLAPSTWHIVYYDADATFKAVEVKFAGGRKVDVKRSARIIERGTGADKPLPNDKLKIDSDKAISIAVAEPVVNKLTIKATKLTLEKWGPADLPIWKVRLYAAKLKKPQNQADLGEMFISAEDGKVVKLEVHPDRVD